MGKYEGELKLKWLADGRIMELLDFFAFIDQKGKRWEVPTGSRIDGASIPQFLWTIVGSPYVGKYRDASVVHDFYCSVRIEPSDKTHKMFFEAMLVSGVSQIRALVMYAAVRYAGPRWSDMDVHNSNLKGTFPRSEHYWGPGGMPPFDTADYAAWQKQRAEESKRIQQPKVLKDANQEEFRNILAQIQNQKLNLSAIDELFDHIPSTRFEVFPQSVHPFPNENPMNHGPIKP